MSSLTETYSVNPTTGYFGGQSPFFQSTRETNAPQINDVSPQGTITVNAVFNLDELTRRQIYTDTVDLNGRMGTYDKNLVGVIPREPTFYEISDRAFTGGNNGRPHHVAAKVFSSFNGVLIRSGAETQESLEKRYAFAGFSNAYAYANDPHAPQTGISLKVAGSMTTYNNGEDVFAPYDLISYRLPNIDREKRDAERKKFKKFDGIPEGKFTAIMTRHRPENAQTFASEAVMQCFENPAIMDIQNLSRHSKANLSDSQTLGLNLIFGDLGKLLAGLAVLQDYGLITINAPRATSSKSSITPENYRKADNVLSRELGAVRKLKIEMDGSTGNFKSSDDTTAQNFNLKAQRLEYLGWKLGLREADPQRKWLSRNENLQTTVAMAMNQGLLTNNNQREYFSISHCFEGGGALGKRRTPTGAKVWDLSKNSGAFGQVQSDAAVRAVHGMAKSIAWNNSKILGTTLYSSIPGAGLDLKM